MAESMLVTYSFVCHRNLILEHGLLDGLYQGRSLFLPDAIPFAFKKTFCSKMLSMYWAIFENFSWQNKILLNIEDF